MGAEILFRRYHGHNFIVNKQFFLCYSFTFTERVFHHVIISAWNKLQVENKRNFEELCMKEDMNEYSSVTCAKYIILHGSCFI